MGKREGSFAPWWREMEVKLFGRAASAMVTYRGRPLPAEYDAAGQTLQFTLPGDGKGEMVVEVHPVK